MNVASVLSTPAPVPVGEYIPLALAADARADLLRAIADALDVRDVFGRLATIAARILPHDCLDLVVQDAFGHVTTAVRSNPRFPGQHPASLVERGEFCLVRDLRALRSQDIEGRRGFVDDLAHAGCQSFICVRTSIRDCAIRVGFFSTQLDAYTVADLPAARLIVEAIAVVVAHQQLAKGERARAQADARAERLDARVVSLTRTSGGHPDAVRAIGDSPEWRRVLRQSAQVALAETTVFVQGESGTGKEVLARFIHRASPRKNGPFIAINCAALPEQLLESELFGYDRGAFTGAQQGKAGQIELASGGVLFLDEVSEMSPTAQAKLLRFLQEREFLRLGGTRPIKANVRVIAASNRDLSRAVAEGTFREDLYYRLQVFDIQIPPLRERRGDIPLLASAFLQEFNRSIGCSSAGMTAEATALLMRYDWPGNVRQLRNAIERATVLCQGGLIGPEHFSLRSDTSTASATDLPEVERRTIEQVLRDSDGNKSKAARRLGITRTQLYGRLRKYDLD